MNKKNATIQTHTGRLVNPFYIKNEDIVIEDIAYSLSMQCRFNGHTNRFFSVAEHSINVTSVLKKLNFPAKTQLLGLLHDASEAYLADILAPIKECLPDYLSIENDLSISIYKELHPQYGELSVNDFYFVGLVDKEMAVLEGREFMSGNMWDKMTTSFTINFGITKNLEDTRKVFLELYSALWKEIANEQATNRTRNI